LRLHDMWPEAEIPEAAHIAAYRTRGGLRSFCVESVVGKSAATRYSAMIFLLQYPTTRSSFTLEDFVLGLGVKLRRKWVSRTVQYTKPIRQGQIKS